MSVDSITEWEYHDPNAYEEVDIMDYSRLIDNAWEAFHNSKTDWAKNYWTIVVQALMRRVPIN
jgi:hypothetical protein